MRRLYNLLGIATSVTVLSAVMLVVSVAAQPARAEQQPDTLLRETIEQLLDELRSNRPKYEADKCQLYSLVNDLVLPQFAIDKTVRLILGKHFKAASPEMRSRFTDAFMKMMIRTYAIAMFEYTEQGLVPPPPEILELNESAGTVLLRQRVPVSGQAPVLVDYVMWRSKDLGSYQAFDSPHSSIICCFSVCTASAAAFPSTMLKPADLSLMQFCCGDRYQ